MRQKVTLRLNPEVLELVREMARDLGISPAGAIDRLLLDALERYAQGRLDFEGCLEPAARGRYEWRVVVGPNGHKEALLALLQRGEKP